MVGNAVVIWWDESTECLLVLMRRGIANLRGLDLNELQNALYDRLCTYVIGLWQCLLWWLLLRTGSSGAPHLDFVCPREPNASIFVHAVYFKPASLKVSWWSRFLLNVVCIIMLLIGLSFTGSSHG